MSRPCSAFSVRSPLGRADNSAQGSRRQGRRGPPASAETGRVSNEWIRIEVGCVRSIGRRREEQTMSDDGFGVQTGAYDSQSVREGADDALLQQVGAMFRSADPVP